MVWLRRRLCWRHSPDAMLFRAPTTTPPAAYRTEGGVRIDNAGYKLDPLGHRIGDDGERSKELVAGRASLWV